MFSWVQMNFQSEHTERRENKRGIKNGTKAKKQGWLEQWRQVENGDYEERSCKKADVKRLQEG